MKWHLMNTDICLCGDTEIKGGLLWWFSGKQNLPAMQETGVQSLIQEDATGQEATRLVYQLLSLCSRAQEP